MEYLISLLSDERFMPHGHCYLWIPELLWLNVISDGLIALAYLTIPITLVYFIRKRRDLPFNWMFGAFGVFILACGSTHVMDIWTIWHPDYWLSAFVKALTAVASVVTAVLLVKLIPAALLIPSQQQLARVNAELMQTNRELQQANRHLAETHEQLLQSEKMAALGGLVAGVAHEINTPVGIVITSASLLVRDTHTLRCSYENDEGLTEEELEDYLSIAEQSAQLIEANATRAADLIQSFKQVAVDQTAGEPRQINVRDYIGETLTSLSPSLKKAAATVTVEGPGDLVVTTYPGALAQILTNLVLNSLIHGFDNGAAGQIRIALATRNAQVILSYADNGKGIPPELRSKVFEPFFTTRRNEGGSGLGLHILYNLVTRTLGGSVRVDDPPGGGVRFVIAFPSRASQPILAG
ncbi:MAG: HAMP domain-containing histidine kinase [Pseudogulbenkiania sp.]|nr:HAMP domain-containing histidine kinase [Pseudogulbenkiania sp.]